jgi:hypothetical protein
MKSWQMKISCFDIIIYFSYIYSCCFDLISDEKLSMQMLFKMNTIENIIAFLLCSRNIINVFMILLLSSLLVSIYLDIIFMIFPLIFSKIKMNKDKNKYFQF